MNESMKDLTLGRRIAHLRKAQGLTQDALAERLCITASGRTRVPIVKDIDHNSRLHSLFTKQKGEQAYETDHLRIQHGQRLRGAAI